MVVGLRMLVLIAMLALVATSCGDDESADEPGGASVSTEVGGDDGSGGADEGSSGSDDGPTEGGNGVPVIDPSAMPDPGQIVFEVDGQTFTVAQGDVDFYTCDIGDDFLNVRAESETQNATVQVDRTAGSLANANLQLDDPGVRYDSFVGPQTTGGVAIEPPYILYVGRFDSTHPDDPADITDVGTGRAAVTCP